MGATNDLCVPACVCVCVCFWTSPIASYLWFHSDCRRQCFSAVSHVAWRIRLGRHGSGFHFPLTYTETHIHAHANATFSTPSVSSSLSLRSPCNVLSPHAISNFIEQQRESEQPHTRLTFFFFSPLCSKLLPFLYIRLHTVASIKYTCCFAPGHPPPPPCQHE